MRVKSKEQGKFPELVKAIREAPVEMRKSPDGGEYPFRRFAFGEKGGYAEPIMPKLIGEVNDSLVRMVRPYVKEFDCIVTTEPGGHRWATAIVSELNVDLLIAARSLESLDKIALINSVFRQASGKKQKTVKQYVDFVPQKSGYEKNTLYVPRPRKGERVAIVEDVVSSGGTANALADYFEAAGAKVTGIFCIVTKGDGYKELEKRGIPVHALLHLTKSGEIVN